LLIPLRLLAIFLFSVVLLFVFEEADVRHHMKIQDHPQSFYETFDIVIAGLDSIPARRWMNATMVQIAQEGNIIPLIDGGTEGMLYPSSTGAVADDRIQGSIEGDFTYC
jgi:hypothetical protein